MDRNENDNFIIKVISIFSGGNILKINYQFFFYIFTLIDGYTFYLFIK